MRELFFLPCELVLHGHNHRSEVGRIDGSIYSDMVIHDLILRDPKGVFAVSPRVHVVWKPFRYLNNHISVSLLETPLVVLARSPQFNQTPTDPNAPILPDLDIDVVPVAVYSCE